MNSHLKCVAYSGAATLAFLFSLGAVGAWSTLPLLLFVFLGALPFAIFVLIGSVILLIRGLRLVKALDLPNGKKIRVALISPAMIVTALLCTLPALWTGAYLGTWMRFLINRDHYDRIVVDANSRTADGAYSEYLTNGGTTYIIDYGPPVRVAFNPDGFLDNWSGIIFDPTGDVLLAKGFDSKTGAFFAPERITKLFGGDLVDCRHLSGNYFHCSFT